MIAQANLEEALLLSGVFPERWLKVFPDFAKRLGAANMHCTQYSVQDRRMAIDGFWSMGVIPVFPDLARYLACDHNPWISAASSHPHGTWLTTDDLILRTELYKTPFYDDLIKPMNIEESFGVIVPGTQPYTFVFYRPRAHGRFPMTLKGEYRGLVGSLSAAMALAEVRRAWGGAFGRLQEGPATVVVDERMRVYEENGPARRLGPRDLVYLDGDRLCCATNRLVASLRGLINELLTRGTPTGFTRCIHLHGPGARQVEVIGAALRLGRHLAALTIRDQFSLLRDDIAKLSRSLAEPLTEAEVDVAVQMCAGLSVTEIAQARSGCAERTITKHFANINKKLGCHARYEATAILLGLRDTAGQPSTTMTPPT